MKKKKKPSHGDGWALLFVWEAGLGGSGSSSYIDDVILRDKDAGMETRLDKQVGPPAANWKVLR